MRKFLGNILPIITGSVFIAGFLWLLLLSRDPVNIAFALIIILMIVIAVLVVFQIKHENSHPSRSKSSGRCTGVFVALLIFAVGFGIMYAGWRAIDRNHFEIEWSARGIIGEFIGTSDDSLAFDGREARRVGIGLISLGSMVVIWGILSSAVDVESRLGRLLVLPAFACMLAAVGFIFPPWRPGSLPFYCIAVPIPVFMLTRPAETYKRWNRTIISGLFFSLLAASFLGETVIAAIIVCGMLANLAFALHVEFLFPKLREKSRQDSWRAGGE